MQAWASRPVAPRVHAASAAEEQLELLPDNQAPKAPKAPKACMSKSVWATLVTAFSTRRIRIHHSQDEEVSVEVRYHSTRRHKSAANTRPSPVLPPIPWASEGDQRSSSLAVPKYSSTRCSSHGSSESQSPLIAVCLGIVESKQCSRDYHDSEDLLGSRHMTSPQLQKKLETDVVSKSQVTPQQLEKTIEEISNNISSFDDDNFNFVRPLQEAPRNKGQVDHMKMLNGKTVCDVAVKKMPKSWMLGSHCEFQKRHASEREQPWVDIGILKELNTRGYQYACDLMGVFAGDNKMFIVTSLAEKGDLLSWIDAELAQVGRDREGRIRFVAAQLCDAACWLHELGIAHRDVSLENIVLTGSKEAPALKLIDFGMAVAARHSQGAGHGKGPYRAPEMHTHIEYDAFLADTFAIGVVILSLVLASYPWKTTRPGRDPKFINAMLVGMSNYLELMTTRLPGGAVVPLSQVASTEMLELLVGLLALQPCGRQTLGESCFLTRVSVWNGPWLGGRRPNHALQDVDSGAKYAFLPEL
mmetsp:Transcript_71554/g.141913  ORF Transcript_71554/g.141913 Transcript_71554/m.141913 type:complete len:528 (-) Transcript_71554:153-1736(-)